MNDVPLRDHITPHYVHLGLLKFRDIVEFMYNCLFLYDYVSDNKPCNFPLLIVSEQHDYFTRSASAQQLKIPHSRINIRKFCPTVIGKHGQKFRTTQRRTRRITRQYGRQTLKGNVWQK